MMNRWSAGTAGAIYNLLFPTMIVLAVWDTVAGHPQQVFLRKEKEATVNRSAVSVKSEYQMY